MRISLNDSWIIVFGRAIAECGCQYNIGVIRHAGTTELEFGRVWPIKSFIDANPPFALGWAKLALKQHCREKMSFRYCTAFHNPFSQFHSLTCSNASVGVREHWCWNVTTPWRLSHLEKIAPIPISDSRQKCKLWGPKSVCLLWQLSVELQLCDWALRVLKIKLRVNMSMFQVVSRQPHQTSYGSFAAKAAGRWQNQRMPQCPRRIQRTYSCPCSVNDVCKSTHTMKSRSMSLPKNCSWNSLFREFHLLFTIKKRTNYLFQGFHHLSGVTDCDVFVPNTQKFQRKQLSRYYPCTFPKYFLVDSWSSFCERDIYIDI